MIKLKNISKTYTTDKKVSVEALKDVNITFGDNGLCFIVGKSGSGKSTLLNLLGGLDGATSGDIYVNGKALDSMSRKAADRYRADTVGFVFQDYNLIEEIGVKGNLNLALMLKGEKARPSDIEKALEAVGLNGFADRKPSELSGGQKQRVAIARALIKNPDIILADEPTGNLDSESGASIFELLKTISKTRLVVVVTHDTEAAMKYGDRTISVSDGMIVGDTAPVNYSNEASANSGSYKKKKNKLGPVNTVRLGSKFMSKHVVRMIVSIVLFAFSLTLFGVGYTAATYDAKRTEYEALAARNEKIVHFVPDVKSDVPVSANTHTNLSKAQFEALKSRIPEFKLNALYSFEDKRAAYLNFADKKSDDLFHAPYLSGVTSLAESDLGAYGMKTMCGRLPSSYAEIAISRYTADYFLRYGIADTDSSVTLPVPSYEALIGKKAELTTADITILTETVTICGIVDTGYDFSRYKTLKSVDLNNLYGDENTRINNLQSELEAVASKSIHNAAFVSAGYIETVFEKVPVFGASFAFNSPALAIALSKDGYSGNASAYSAITYLGLDAVRDGSGELNDDEVILSEAAFRSLYADANPSALSAPIGYEELDEFLAKGAEITATVNGAGFSSADKTETRKFKVAGYVRAKEGTPSCDFYFSSAYAKEKLGPDITENIYTSAYTALTGEKSKDLKLIGLSYDSGVDEIYTFPISWSLSSSIRSSAEIAVEFAKIGLYASIAFVVFAMLMVMNFISSTIASSRKQIGILSAMGAGRSEVLRIFLTEAILIAVTAFVLALPGIFGISSLLNKVIYGGSEIPFMTVRFTGVLVTLALSLAGCVIGSVIPIARLSAKKPVDVIKA